MPERLQKVLAAAGLASRRTCEVWIREGRVAVDGHTITEMGTLADPATQKITVDGRPVPRRTERRHYIALHKPRSYACTLADSHAAKLITQLVDLPGKPLLRPVGRLDIESEGLLFLSDDGDFINHLTHPRYHVPKTYLATVRGTPPPEALTLLKNGVLLDDGPTAPADHVRFVKEFPGNGTSDVELTIHEGRKRQVRRMFREIGYPVLRLVRIRVGFVSLAGLPSGAWRHLTPAEVKRLMQPPEHQNAAPTTPAACPRQYQRSTHGRYQRNDRNEQR